MMPESPSSSKDRATQPWLIHRIDASDRLIFADPAWWQFARDNDASELVPNTVLGRLLWDFIAGDEVRYLYRLILARVRSSGTVMVTPLRCDAPHVRRFVNLVIIPGEEGRIQFESHLLREEVREPVELLSPMAKRADWLVRMCAWCKSVHVASEWVQVEIAVERLNLFEMSSLPGVTHTICPECERRVRYSLRRLEAGSVRAR
jgi:hypothetical protein